MTFLDRLLRRRPRLGACIPTPLPRVARVFISSTFKDMQRERDILVRAVFPRLRERMTLETISLYEVDLRWGITQEDSENKRAVSLCLEEIDTCHPLFFCMLGERYGWRPSLTELASFEIADLPVRAGVPPSVTEIEIRRALSKASEPGHRGARPIFLLRSRRLSERLGSACEDPVAMESLKTFVRARGGEFVVEYDDFETFEAQAERLLEGALADWKQSEAVLPRGKAHQDLDRPSLATALARACGKCRPAVLTGAPSSGLSTLGRRWLAEAGDRGVLIDARAISQRSLAHVLIEARSRLDPAGTRSAPAYSSIDEEIDRLINALKETKPGRGRIFLDHFEEAFTSDARADLRDLPQSLPDGVELLVSTRSQRLLDVAKTREFDVVLVPDLGPAERDEFIRGLLGVYGKRLTGDQVRCIANAAFAARLGALVLCLDELRRYGQFDSLDERLAELVRCASDDELVQSVLDGLRVSVPSRFSQALDSILIALGMSLRGLHEDELSYAASLSSGDCLPPQVWSTFRIGLGRAIQWREARVDLTSGPVRRFAESLVTREPDLARRVGSALLDHLASSNRERWIEEAPQILFLMGGEGALEHHLSDVNRMSQLLAFAKTYAVGCLEQLSLASRLRACGAWSEGIRDSDTAQGLAWELGNVAAQVGAVEPAKKLFDIDARLNQSRPDRWMLEVLALKSAARPEALAGVAQWRIPELDGRKIGASMSRETLAQIWTQAATVLGLVVEGLVQEEPGRQEAWCGTAVESAAALGDDSASAQAHLLAGQLQLNLARWKEAATSFERAARHARRCGNARRLVSALERGATAALELQCFKEARTLASECLSMARQCTLFDEECLAFERLIEVERRRANWEAAFDWVAQYLARTRAAGLNVERAQACLSSLET